MGGKRKQSQSEVLPVDVDGTAPVASGNGKLEAARGDDCSDPGCGTGGIMIFLAQLRSIAAGLLRRRRIESLMQDEMRFHIEAYTDDLVRSGVARPEAE